MAPVEFVTRALRFLCVVFASVTWLVGIAEAQAPGSPLSDEALAADERARAYFTQGKYNDACTEWMGIYQKYKYVAFLDNAGTAAKKHADTLPQSDRNPALLYAMSIYRSRIQITPDDEIGETIRKIDLQVSGAVGSVPTPEIRSFVIIQSDPPGAPISIYRRKISGATPFQQGSPNVDWEKIRAGTGPASTPLSLALKGGFYHVAWEAYKGLSPAKMDVEVKAGRNSYHLMANLRGTNYYGMLQVKSPVENARVFVDNHEGMWGRAPHSAPIVEGSHKVWVEAPGYETFIKTVVVRPSEQTDVVAELVRVEYGILRLDGKATQEAEVEVEVDGKPSGTFRPAEGSLLVRLPAGQHHVVLNPSWMKKYRGDIQVYRGQEVAVHGSFAELRSFTAPVILGLLAGGCGVVLAETDQIVKSDNPDRDKLRRGIRVGTGVGTALFGTLSLVFLVYDPSPDSSVSVDTPIDLREDSSKPGSARLELRGISPFLSARGGGISVLGAF